MAETVQLQDIIEIDYTGTLDGGKVFDTTKESVAKAHQLPMENARFEPAIICVGEKQVLPGLDEALLGKSIGATVQVKLAPEQAFGRRDVKNIKIVPLSTFYQHKVDPQPGLQVNMDGQMGTVIRLAGGRVMVNFNHPLAGREVIYEVMIHRKITEPKEQLQAFLHATLRIPGEKMIIIIKENKAEIQLPVVLPPPLLDILAKKLSGITKLEVTFSSPKNEANLAVPSSQSL